MKTSKIAIPYILEDPTNVALADVPTHCEVVHVSGNASTAYLHITEADEPKADRTPTAFYVIRDGVDVEDMVVCKGANRPSTDPGRCRDGEEDEKVTTYVRRIGKFEVDGEAVFVFERLS